MEKVILKYALQNAVLHGGRANPKAVLGKVLSENPDQRGNIKEISKIIESTVDRVNKMDPEEQKKEMSGFEFKKPQEKEKGLSDLENAVEGKVVTRFAPSPTGPLNILHVLRAVSINYLYAKKYKGKFILRFEDTDPKNIEKKYYEMIKEDLANLEIKPDREFVQSDYMNLYYKQAEQLLKDGKAYVCFCDAKDFQLLKRGKKDCPCRWNRPDKNILGWNGMLQGRYPEGKAVIRLQTSMQDPNPAFRDPPLMRIAEGKHPIHGKKYRVWPLYNFANVVMDEFCGVTHVFRGKEHEHNTAIQQRIYNALGSKSPEVVNFGMMYLPGEKIHTRDIKKGIEEGKYSGWDDLKLHTVRAFIRRGFLPKAFKEFSIYCGLSKNDIRIDLGNLAAINRKFIDTEANRYMIVPEPKEVDISEIKKITGLGDFVIIKNHPDREDTRNVSITDKLFIAGEDYERFVDRNVRLIDLFNVKLEDKCKLSTNQEFDARTPKIQWVSEKNTKVRILMAAKEVNGVGEEVIKKLKPGDIIQMVRLGFGRVEKPGVIVFAHK